MQRGGGGFGVAVFQEGICPTQTSGCEQTFRKNLLLAFGVSFMEWDGPPPKFGWNVCPSNWTGAIATSGAGEAFPQGSVGCGVIQIFGVFATCRVFPIETEASGGTFVGLLPPGGAIFAQGTGTLVLKRFCQTIAAGTTGFVIELALVAGLACRGTGGAGCASDTLCTRSIGWGVANCSGFTRFEPRWSRGVNFRPKWYDYRR